METGGTQRLTLGLEGTSWDTARWDTLGHKMEHKWDTKRDTKWDTKRDTTGHNGTQQLTLGQHVGTRRDTKWDTKWDTGHEGTQ